jgi:hypothetical protein
MRIAEPRLGADSAPRSAEGRREVDAPIVRLRRQSRAAGLFLPASSDYTARLEKPLLDFSAERAKHLVFFERKDLFTHLDHLLCEGTQWIVVSGSPGVGKSAILANYLLQLESAGMDGYLGWAKSWLSRGTAPKSPLGDLAARIVTVKATADRRLVPHHFIKYGYNDWAVAPSIEESLAQQLGLAFPKLVAPDDRRLSNLLKRIASDVLVPQQRRLILVIDGLDQIEGDHPTNPLFEFLPAQLPDGISVLCSARPTHGDLSPLDWVSPIRIDLDTAEWAESNDAVRQACLRAHAEKIGRVPDYAAAVLKQADGNLRFLVEQLARLAENPRADLKRPAHRFADYLDDLWQFLLRFGDRRDELVRAGLGVLAKGGWLGQVAIASATAWPQAEDPYLFFKTVMPVLLSAHSDEGPIYRLFHPSFGDYVSMQLNRDQVSAASTAAMMFREMLPFAFFSKAEATAAAIETKPVSKRFALLVGIDKYVETSLGLRYCVNDARAMHQCLTTLGYSAATLHDTCENEEHRPSLFNIRAALAKLKGRFKPDELLLVYFAGHGMLVDGKPYLMARDSRSADPVGSGLPLSDVEAFMRSSGSRRLLLVLDACHAGVELGRDVGPSSRGIDPNFIHNAYEMAEGFAILAGSTAAQKTQDFSTVEHGVFTYYLLKGLSGKADGGTAPKGFVTVDDLKNYVLSAVRTWCFENMADIQLPTARIEGIGDMIVAYTNPTANLS